MLVEDFGCGVDGEDGFFGLGERGGIDVGDGDSCAACAGKGFGYSCTDACVMLAPAYGIRDGWSNSLPVPPAPVMTATPRRCLAIDAMLEVIMAKISTLEVVA